MSFANFDALLNALTGGQADSFFWWKRWPSTTSGGAFYTCWGQDGIPAAGDYSGTALNAQQLTGSSTGAIGFADPGGGKTRHLTVLGAGGQTSSATGQLILVDRLLYYPGISHTSSLAQSLVNGVSLPRYTSGANVMAWLEVTTTLGGTAQNVTLTYTDDQGNTGNTTTDAIVTSSAVGRLPHNFLFFPLAQGDKGIRSVQAVQFSAGNSAGASALVLGVPLATLPITAAAHWFERDLVAQLPSLPQFQDGACLSWLFCPINVVTTPTISGLIQTAYA